MIKLLAFCDDPSVFTGFGRVTDHVLKPLADSGEYEIILCALNYSGDMRDPDRYPYWYFAPYLSEPASLYGTHRINELVARVEPDVVWLFNDLPIIASYYDAAAEALGSVPVVTYSPIDGDPFPTRYLDGIRYADIPIVYTEYGKRVITEMDEALGKRVEVIPHGHDPEEFYPFADTKAASKAICAEKMRTYEPSLFIVLRVDKNQARKRWDSTIRVFSRFAEDKPDVKLWMHTQFVREAGYDIPALCEIYGIAEKVLNSGLSKDKAGVSVQALNAIYNACDVHLSTTAGGGWELSTHEAKAAGTPTIITDYAAMSEVGREGGYLIPCTGHYISIGNSVGRGEIDEDLAVSALDMLYYNHELREQTRRDALRWAKGASWGAQRVAERFDQAFRRAIEAHGAGIILEDEYAGAEVAT